MTRADIVKEITDTTGIDKEDVQNVVKQFMNEVKIAVIGGRKVYFRGFGTFAPKKRAKKTGRNISQNTPLIVPAHNIPSFKPVKKFRDAVKKNVPV